jgi:hypothetical protein
MSGTGLDAVGKSPGSGYFAAPKAKGAKMATRQRRAADEMIPQIMRGSPLATCLFGGMGDRDA